MADNTQLDPGSGGDLISTDVITTLNGGGISTGEKAQRIKVGWGADATLNDANASTPLPVVQTGTPGLPTGASTAAKQPALGTAGTASADVITVQGKASMTPILTDGSATTQPVSGTVTAGLPADVAPATQNVTVIDTGSSSATGANNQTVVIGTPTAGSAASFSLSSIETVRIMVTGIWTGTLTAEQSLDGGTTWTNIGVHQGAYTTSSFTAGFVGGANIAGATNFRMRATAAITGTAVVKVIESINTQSVYIANAAPSGTVISVSNSTTATLTSGSVFTGVGEDVTNFSEMRVSVFSDVASATDGLSLQQSSNNTNWDLTDTYTVSLSAAGAGKTYVIPRQARFFRVVYTNGGTNQASFRLQTILNRTATAPSSQRPTDGYTNETDLVQGQAFLMGNNGTTWDRLRSDITNGLDVDVTRMPALVAGAAVIGKVGIDQTTPGTTNLVALAANQSVNVTQFNGTTAVNGSGNATGALRVELPTNGTGVVGLNVGTNSIGKISDITTSVVPGTAATNLGKAEDAGHSSGDTGVSVLYVRNDTLADKTNTDVDYSAPSTDIKGRVMTAGAPRSLKGMTQVQLSNTTSETTILAATASTFHDVYGIILANTGASTTKVSIRDDTAGTVRAIIEVPTLETRGFMLPVDSAVPQTAVNKNWTAQCGTATTALEVTLFYVSML